MSQTEERFYEGKETGCECGHVAVASGSTTGYAVLRVEKTVPSTGVTIPAEGRACFACADELEREDLKQANTFFAYLSGDGKRITTWTGGKLADVTGSVEHKVGFHGSTRIYFDAVDVHGVKWYGTTPGTGMYARMRRRKQQ